MKKQEIKKLSKDEVLKNIDKLKKDLFNFRCTRSYTMNSTFMSFSVLCSNWLQHNYSLTSLATILFVS